MTARFNSHLKRLVFLSVTLGSALSLSQTTNVTTWHNDNWRTGQNTNETALTTTLVGDPTKFGRVCSNTTLDGKIYPQPLIVTKVKFNGTFHSVVACVATENDTVYAIDGTNCSILGHKSLLVGSETAANCHDIAGNCLITPTVGILGTPVIEIDGTNPTTTGVLFAVAESESSGPTLYHRIWALDITSLSEVNGGHAQICASGCENESSSNFSQTHIQRPGLLWLSASQAGRQSNMVYVAISMMDGAGGNPNGWIWGYNAQNLAAAPLSFETTDDSSGGRRGGIWQAAGGLAAGLDSATGSTYIFFSTGDGDFNLDSTGGKNAGDSFVKISPSLPNPPSGYFTPSDQCYRYNQDKDYGSGGVMLLPDGTHPNYPYVALKGEKLNDLWVMDRGNPGGFHAGGCTRITDCTQGTLTPCDPAVWDNRNLQALSASSAGYEARSSPAFWSGNSGTIVKGWAYFAATYDVLKAYAVATSCTPFGGAYGPVLCGEAFQSQGGLGYSSTPSVSSNGNSNGIVWAIRRDDTSAKGLHAFDATNLTELWNSNQCVDPTGLPRDQSGIPTRFSVPTIANGNVYIGTETDFDIYGQVTQRTCGVGF
jgi:hypothetical protein